MKDEGGLRPYAREAEQLKVLAVAAVFAAAAGCTATPEQRARRWATEPNRELQRHQAVERLRVADRSEALSSISYCFGNTDIDARRMCIVLARDLQLVELAPELLRHAEAGDALSSEALKSGTALDRASGLRVAMQYVLKPESSIYPEALSIVCGATAAEVAGNGLDMSRFDAARKRCDERATHAQCSQKYGALLEPCRDDCQRVYRSAFEEAARSGDVEGRREVAMRAHECQEGCRTAMNASVAACGKDTATAR